MILAFLLLTADATTAELGTADAACRPGDTAPEIMITVKGLKDGAGKLRAELYPDSDPDFLASDVSLTQQHKTFRRVVIPAPDDGQALICLRAPAPGSYSLTVVHDRNGTRKFDLLHDGAGFAGNPRIGWRQPPAAAARIAVGPGITETTIVMNYYRGLLSFGPIPTKNK